MIVFAAIVALALVVSLVSLVASKLDTPERRARRVIDCLRERPGFTPDQIYVCPFGERAVACDVSAGKLCLLDSSGIVPLRQKHLHRVAVLANGSLIAEGSAKGRRGNRAAIERVLATGLYELRLEISYHRSSTIEHFSVLLAEPLAVGVGITTPGMAVEQGVDCYQLLAQWVEQGVEQARRERLESIPLRDYAAAMEIEDVSEQDLPPELRRGLRRHEAVTGDAD